MSHDAVVPPLRLREVLLVLLVVAAAVAAIVVKTVTSHPGNPAGNVADRLASGRGAYEVTFPPHTTLAEARAIVLKPFPRDVRTTFYAVLAYCATQVVTSRELERKAPSGVVGMEFLSQSKRSDRLPLLDENDVRRALVALLDSTQGQPGC